MQENDLLQNVGVIEVVKLSMSQTPFPRHLDGIGPYPVLLKLSCSGQTPVQQ